MKNINTISRTMLLFMVLLSSLSTYAQKAMIGDGFGGRTGYCPTNFGDGNRAMATICGANNQLYVWGSNFDDNFGSNTPDYSVTPVAVPGMTNVIQYSSGRYYSAAIKSDGTGWVWGTHSTFSTWVPPAQVITDVYYCTIGSMTGGTANAYFVKKDGTVWTVGNSVGYYGSPGAVKCVGPNTDCAVQMQGITTAKRIATLNNAVFILLADGSVMRVLSGQVPSAYSGLSNIVAMADGANSIHFLTNTGQVYKGDAILSAPVLVTFPSTAAPIKAITGNENGEVMMALDDNGNVYTWGGNTSGQLGTGSVSSIVSSPGLRTTNVRDIIAGYNYTAIIKNDGTLWAAGDLQLCGLNLATPTVSGNYRTSYTQLNHTTSPYNLCATPTACATGMPACVAGTTAPTLTPTTATNSCPATTVDLTSLAISSTTPSGASLIWSTNKVPTSAADTLTTAQKTAVSTTGTYYALYYDATNACYSPADSVTITITSCGSALTASTPTAQTATTNQAKTGNAATELAPTGGTSPYTYSNGSGDAACVAPSGATALTGLTVNANGTYSYTAPATAGTYYYCIKVSDSATPTASGVTKVYTLTVTAGASCTVTGIVPTIIKN